MPKGLNLKTFGRRKSSGNALDFEQEAPTDPPPQSSSFRVLERSDKRISTYGAQDKVNKGTFNSPLSNLRGKSVDNLGLGPNRSVQHNPSGSEPWVLNVARGSGGTTNSGSSGYYDSSSASARHSSTSTLPSSLEQEHKPDDEELFSPVRKSTTAGMYLSAVSPANEPPVPPPPKFTARAARALSFGKDKSGKAASKDVPPVPPPHATTYGPPIPPARSHSPPKERERAMTTSSYASTAVPPKTELTLTTADFGDDDFGSMFDSLKRSSQHLPQSLAVSGSYRTESEPMFPPRTYSRQALTPSPNPLRLVQSAREHNDSPYYSDDRSSNDGLMSNSALSSPDLGTDGNAPGPAAGNGVAQAFLGGNSYSGYARVPEQYNSPGLKRASVDSYSSIVDDERPGQALSYPNRQTQVDDGDRWVKRVELRDPQEPSSFSPVGRRNPIDSGVVSVRQPTGMPVPAKSGAISPSSSTGKTGFDSNTTTPRAVRGELRTVAETSLFDTSPVGPPSVATRPGMHQRSESGQKRMTKAQFQALQKHGEHSGEHSEEEDLSGEDYDDEDDVERAKKMATHRRKQEANMAVYRQQMKKVTGGGPTDLPSSAASTVRPSIERGSSAPSVAGGGFHFGGIGGTPPADTIRGKQLADDDDDDVPLGILQAHGFPSNSRPPTGFGENDFSHQRRTSVAGSAIVNGGAGQGNLPPFARRLPADPYFGAGLVNHSTRESLQFGGSVVGGPTTPIPQQSPMGHPGGLVGVIAGEERARAARRGSPNTVTGHYNMSGALPLPANMHASRSMSMGNVTHPSMYGAPPMPQMPAMPQMMGMPQMPTDSNPLQMQQFMQMQMQIMQNLLTMQNAQMGQITPQGQQQQAGDYLGSNFSNAQRPMSIASQSPPQVPQQGRAMTMINPPTGWAQPLAGSTRPNSAMALAGGSYAPSASGANLGGGGPGPGYTPSIAPSERSNIGMPTRYRPVTQNGDGSRTQSMTSSLTLQAFAKQQTSPNLPGTPFGGTQVETPKSTIRVVDKPKGVLKTSTRAVEEDDEEGWADMRKQREEKKKSKWSLKKKTASTDTTTNESSFDDLTFTGLQ